ncbi:CubicO group peptidase (beta-lactamase class C family) [Erythromicrobium ramosum]|uniref:CubicO group peptidase (Beta-lactamase class C family) n=2 Tax=Erythrobacter ramosus TaxID=35811 RepID=A0ABR6HUA8_9SPHN|nr:serine hydrolase domain-containing protein [Erythrobacter ramosus]MBB3774200.1 CubicO group peptidase (beta-lactamase class C family) [Erythrobacter ramosus]
MMRGMIRRFLAALVFIAAPATAQETAPSPATPPATVVVAFNRETITPLIVEGLANLETARPVAANDPVRIASISKLIMALTALRLVDEGKLDLDRDVSDYVGWKVRSPYHPDAPVTLAHLLSHRAGLSDKAGYIIPLGESLEAKFADPAAWRDTGPSGEAAFEYANLGSPLVATALEAASGERYDRLVERLVFAPLGVKACLNWIGCDADMQARKVTLYRHTGEVAADGAGRLPSACTIPVAEGIACELANYVPGTNASIFSPQGGVRIGMLDLAKIGQAFGEPRAFFSDRAKQGFDRAWNTSFHPDQEFFCIYGLHLQIIDSSQALWANAEQPKPATCRDELFGDGVARVGHSGEAYGLQSGLWFDLGTGRGFAYFLTQVPPPAGGEDTGGFTAREKALMARAQAMIRK